METNKHNDNIDDITNITNIYLDITDEEFLHVINLNLTTFLIHSIDIIRLFLSNLFSYSIISSISAFFIFIEKLFL